MNYDDLINTDGNAGYVGYVGGGFRFRKKKTKHSQKSEKEREKERKEKEIHERECGNLAF